MERSRARSMGSPPSSSAPSVLALLPFSSAVRIAGKSKKPTRGALLLGKREAAAAGVRGCARWEERGVRKPKGRRRADGYLGLFIPGRAEIRACRRRFEYGWVGPRESWTSRANLSKV